MTIGGIGYMDCKYLPQTNEFTWGGDRVGRGLLLLMVGG